MRFSPTVYIYGASPMEVAIELLAPNIKRKRTLREPVQLVQDKGVEPLSNGSQPRTLSIELILYMVSPKGVEPLTNGLEIRCSIH